MTTTVGSLTLICLYGGLRSKGKKKERASERSRAAGGRNTYLCDAVESRMLCHVILPT